MPKATEPTEAAELEAALRIDKTNLDEELIQHPEVFYRVADKVAYLVSQRDAAKQDLAEVEARVDAQIRHDLEVRGEKVTERMVDSEKVLHQQVIKAKKTLHALNDQLGQWQALKEAYQQRGYVLKDLVQLYISNYFGSDVSSSAGQKRTTDAQAARVRMNEARRSPKR
jgi:hypothetical protein